MMWQYDGDQGPSHWGEIAPTTASCEKGTHQSPINIRTTPHHQIHDGLLVHYTAAPGHVITSHHTVEVDFQTGGSLEILGRSSALKEFHFHEPSEHQLNGRTYPMEAHLVHRDETGHLVVLAVLMDLGTESASLSAVWERIPSGKHEEVRDLLFNPRDLLPKDLRHYAYDGSLTTPPCTEGVHWVVIKEPISITATHIERFVSLIGHNVRPVQSLNERRSTKNKLSGSSNVQIADRRTVDSNAFPEHLSQFRAQFSRSISAGEVNMCRQPLSLSRRRSRAGVAGPGPYLRDRGPLAPVTGATRIFVAGGESLSPRVDHVGSVLVAVF